MLCKFHFPQLMLWEWIGKEHQVDIYLYSNIAPQLEAFICFCPVHYPVSSSQICFPVPCEDSQIYISTIQNKNMLLAITISFLKK